MALTAALPGKHLAHASSAAVMNPSRFISSHQTLTLSGPLQRARASELRVPIGKNLGGQVLILHDTRSDGREKNWKT